MILTVVEVLVVVVVDVVVAETGCFEGIVVGSTVGSLLGDFDGLVVGRGNSACIFTSIESVFVSLTCNALEETLAPDSEVTVTNPLALKIAEGLPF